MQLGNPSCCLLYVYATMEQNFHDAEAIMVMIMVEKLQVILSEYFLDEKGTLV